MCIKKNWDVTAWQIWVFHFRKLYRGCTLFWKFRRWVQSAVSSQQLISVWCPLPLLPSVHVSHSLQLSVCPLWTLRPPTCRSGIGISCPTLESKLSAQQRCKRPYIILPTLPYSSTSNFLYLCPLPHHLIPARVRSDRKAPPALTAAGFKSGRPTLLLCIKGQITLSDVIFLRVMAVGWAWMTAPAPAGDAWSGMERRGLTEVLRSYQTECDLNSQQIPLGGIKKSSSEVETKLSCS